MIRKILMVVMVVVVVVIGATLSNGEDGQAAGAGRPYGVQAAPEFGSCGVYAWGQDEVWFVWDQPPAGAVRFQVTFYLKDLRTGVEFLTGGESDAIYYLGDLFGYYEYAFGDSRIRNLTCIAVMEDGSKWSTSSNREWFVYFRFLPVLLRTPTITITQDATLEHVFEVEVAGISERAARMEVRPHFTADVSHHKTVDELVGGDCNGEWLAPGTCWGEVHVYADEAFDYFTVTFYEFLDDFPYYEVIRSSSR